MPKRESPLESEMVPGTLDLLILRTLLLGPAHGQTIAHAIERGSDEVLQVEHGSLYPALHRLQNRGWVASFCGTSDNNRRASPRYDHSRCDARVVGTARIRRPSYSRKLHFAARCVAGGMTSRAAYRSRPN